MKKPIFQFLHSQLHSQKGSMLGPLVAVSVMGISTAGLLYYTVGFEKSVKGNIESRENEVLTTQIALNNIKSLMIAKNINQDGNTVSRNTYGICSLLKKPQIVLGTEQLYFDFRHIRTKADSWGKKRWQVFFPTTEWTVLNNSSPCKRIDPKFSASSFNRCIEYKKANQDASTRTFVIAEIHPLKFPTGKAINLSTPAIDPKTVMFSLTARVGTYHHLNKKKVSGSNSQEITYFHRATDLISASSVGECHVQTQSGEWTTAQFSGTGAGTNLNRLVINDSLYLNQKQCDQIQIAEISRNIVQSGVADTNSLRSINTLNARLSCTTNRFRCKTSSGGAPSFTNDQIDPFRFTFSVIKKRTKPISVKNINITFKKKNSATEWDGTNNRRLDRVSSIGLYGSTNSAPLLYANTNTDQKYALNTGSFTTNIDSSAMDGYCRSICQHNVKVYPVIDIDTPEDKTGTCFKKDFSQSSDESYRVQCSACYMKACHRIGLGTFGPLHQNSFPVAQLSKIPFKQQIIQGLPNEPLDAQIPECYIQNTSYSTTSSNRFPKKVEEKTTGKPLNALKPNEQTKTCLAVKVSKKDDFKNLYNLNNKGSYSRIKCEKKRPVLCFMGGHYLPAMSINNSGSPQLKTTPFNLAQQACYEMGREIGNLRNLGSLFYRAYQPIYNGNIINAIETTMKQLPTSGKGSSNFSLNKNQKIRYNFINNALRGMFLAPVNRSYNFIPNGKITELINKVLNKGKMWTAFELDGGGIPVASVPWAVVAKDDPFAVFFHKNSALSNRPVLLKDTHTIGSNTGQFFALTYNIRWKGLVPMNTNTKAKFVCLNTTNSKYFITSRSEKLIKANTICKKENGVFVPPETTEDWIRLMLELNNNDNQYAFPDPFPSSSEEGNQRAFSQTPDVMISKQVETPFAYVALKATSNQGNSVTSPLARDLRFYVPDSKLPKSSVFNTYLSQFNKTGINGKGVPKNICPAWKKNYRFLSLCVNPKTFLPTQLVKENYSCSNAVKVTHPHAKNKRWRLNSYRYMAKLYQLLKAEEKKAKQANKKILVIMNSRVEDNSSCIEEGQCRKGYYLFGNQCCPPDDGYGGYVGFCYDVRCESNQYRYNTATGECKKRCPVVGQIWNDYGCVDP